MKTLVFFAFFWATTVVGAKGPSPHTAEWILVNAPTVQGREYAVQVACVKFGSRGKGRVEFDALTYGNDASGGWVRIWVIDTKAAEFQRRFGSNLEWTSESRVRTQRFVGVVHVEPGTNTVLVVERDAWAAMEAELKTSIGSAVRTWTSIDGQKIQAELVSATRQTVTIIRHPDEKRFTSPLVNLSKDDQDYVKRWLADAAKAGSQAKE